MKQEHINTQLLKKITADIMAKTPRGRWYGRLVTVARMSLVMLFFFAASFAMSFFLYDLGEKMSMFEFTNSPIIENMTNFLFEFLIIALLGIGGIYIVYRQTDWPLVKKLMASDAAKKNSMTRDTLTAVTSLPYQRPRGSFAIMSSVIFLRS